MTAATGTASAAVVDLGTRGLAAGDLIDPYLDEHFQSASEVHVPAGRYQWSGDGFHGEYEDARLIGEGEVVLETGGARVHQNVHAVGGRTVIKNVTLAGEEDSNDGRIAAWADEGAELVLENFNRPDGSVDGDTTGFYTPPEHAGRIVYRNCTVAGFGNNGVYASAPGKPDVGQNGQVVFEGGVYRNNNVASIRVGGDDAVVRGATVILDGRVTEDSGGGSNGRGIWVREFGENITIEDCDVVITSESDAGRLPIGIEPHDDGGSGTIRNVRIRNDSSSPAITVETGDWSGDAVHLTGSGDLSCPEDFTNVCKGGNCETPTTNQPGSPAGPIDGDENGDAGGAESQAERNPPGRVGSPTTRK